MQISKQQGLHERSHAQALPSQEQHRLSEQFLESLSYTELPHACRKGHQLSRALCFYFLTLHSTVITNNIDMTFHAYRC